MAGNKLSGDEGELEVVNSVPCPNCGKKLMVLPPNYPLFDVQCTGCSFRTQVKTNNSKPKNIIFGAGWDIMEKVLKSGFITPPLIVNFKWSDKDEEKQEIRFYPFVPKTNLEKYRLSEQARRANYMMFRYVGLEKLPHFTVFKKWFDEFRKSINDRVMDVKSIYEGKKYIVEHSPRDNPGKYLESLIAAKGHAWCMDVPAERRKLVKLVLGSITR